MKKFNLIASLLVVLALCLVSCSKNNVIKSGDLVIEVSDDMSLTISTPLSDKGITDGSCQIAALLGPQTSDLVFALDGITKSAVNDEFGAGTRYILNGSAPCGNGKVTSEISLSVYNDFPSTVVAKASFTNATGSDLQVDGWKMDALDVLADDSAPYFWSFQGQSTESRADWLIPIGEQFSQRNYMGMNNSDYGGGMPVVCLWRRDAGVIVGHIEPCPQLVSLPVDKTADKNSASVSILKEYDSPATLADGESVSTYNTFIGVYKGDCFKPMRGYAQLLEKVGVVMPESEPDAFEPAWCAWGYERKFTIDEIIGTLPKVKELGFKWATLDDGYQIAEGDWDLTTERFPRGDEDMKYMVDEIHKYGLKADLWWAPLAADPGCKFLNEHPDAIIINSEGKPQFISWWDSWYLSPVDTNVLAETKRLVEKFIGDYGYEGLKLDGQHMNAVPADYNPAHHPDDPEKDIRELPDFFRLIYNTARGIKPHAVIQYCPCGDCFSIYNMPYTNKTVSSDPESSYQIRTKGYVLRAIAPKTAYYGDHIELSDGGCDFPTQLGIGAVIGTKFTWPNENPRLRHKRHGGYLLTPEKEALLRNALAIYNDLDLAHGEYVPGLYDIGYDYPETHVILQNGKMHYAFYATGDPVSSVELRGLEPGRKYHVEDYYNHVDLGDITASENTVLNAEVNGALLIEVSPVE